MVKLETARRIATTCRYIQIGLGIVELIISCLSAALSAIYNDNFVNGVPDAPLALVPVFCLWTVINAGVGLFALWRPNDIHLHLIKTFDVLAILTAFGALASSVVLIPFTLDTLGGAAFTIPSRVVTGFAAIIFIASCTVTGFSARLWQKARDDVMEWKIRGIDDDESDAEKSARRTSSQSAGDKNGTTVTQSNVQAGALSNDGSRSRKGKNVSQDSAISGMASAVIDEDAITVVSGSSTH